MNIVSSKTSIFKQSVQILTNKIVLKNVSVHFIRNCAQCVCHQISIKYKKIIAKYVAGSRTVKEFMNLSEPGHLDIIEDDKYKRRSLSSGNTDVMNEDYSHACNLTSYANR